MGEYTKENLYSNIPGAGNIFTAGDQTWNQEKIRAYFGEILNQLDTFKTELGEYKDNLMEFINNDTHTGDEADAAKEFVNKVLCVIADDTEKATNILLGMMQDPAFEGTTPLLEDFNADLGEDDTAIVNKAKLDSVIVDFAAYNNDFKSLAKTIKTSRDVAQTIVENCEVITNKTLEDPDSSTTQTSMDDFVAGDGDTGFVPDFLKKFLNFLEEHNDDFSSSTFKELIDKIVLCATMIEEHLGDGLYEPDVYEDMIYKMYLLTQDELSVQEYQDYKEYMNKLQGNPPTNVEANDPVNANNGNYINYKTDLIVGGAHTIKCKRFYNANVERSGILGKGWTSNFEVHLSKNDDTISILYEDGREGIFKKDKLAGKEVFLEIHGDSGVLSKTEDGYRLTELNHSYIAFDNDGYLVSVGDIYGDHTTIAYEVKEVSIDGVKGTKAFPVKVSTKEGSYVELTYDNEGTLLSIRDHSGREITYEYAIVENEKHLVTVNYPNSTARKYTYNKAGYIVSEIRRDGVAAVINDYDSNGRVVHQTMPDGGEFVYDYDDKKHTTTITEPNGNVVEYVADELGRNVKTRYPKLDIEEKFVYNDKNQRISYTDKNGFTTRYTYDNRGHLTGIIGPEGLHEFYTYDAEGNLSSKKDSEGNVTKYKYGLDGNLYSVVNPLGDKVRFYYDEDGKVVSIRDAENNRTNLTYDQRGNIASITDSNGIVTKYECDSLGRVIATEDAEGNRTTYDIDVNNNLRKVVDPEGNVTSYEYNSLGKVSAVVNPDGTRKTWEYGLRGKPTSYTDEDNRTTKVFYNTLAKEEKIVFPNSGELKYEYDLLGNRTGIIDAIGRKTVLEYDKAGQIIKTSVIDSNSNSDNSTMVASYCYDALGRIISTTDGEGNETSYKYDKNGNVIEKVDANGGIVLNEYDAAGRLVATEDQLGRRTNLDYTKTGNLKRLTNSSGMITENIYENNRIVKVIQRAGDVEVVKNKYKYDLCGRVVKQYEEDGYCIEYSYDKAGRIVLESTSNGNKIAYKYDACGRVIELSDAGIVTKYSYTGTGKLKSVVDPLGNRTEYTYNELDLIAKIERFGDGVESSVDVNGHITVYEHNLAGELVSITDALGQKDVYTYDEFGRLNKHFDRDGYEIAYTRDKNGNVTGINYSDGKSVRLKYNALGILEEINDYLGVTKIESDALGRKTKVTDYNGREVGYEYNDYDKYSAVIYPDGKRVEYSHDGFGRIIGISNEGDNNDNLISYSYNDAGRLSEKILPNGVKTMYDYHKGGLLKSLTSVDNNGVLDRYEYHYNDRAVVDQIKRDRRDLENVSGIYNYEYDEDGRLTKTLFNGSLKATYTYDAFGNRISMTDEESSTIYKYDALDRLTDAVRSINGSEEHLHYGYDRRGNQVSLTSDDVIKKTFSFDASGMMVHAHDEEKGDISYDYNGLGFRVKSERPEEKIEYLCDISKDCFNLLQRTVNGECESFIYDDNVVSMNRGGNNYYYLQDELGSTMYLTGTDGITVDSYAYDDFGRRVDPFTGKLKDRRSNRDHSYVKNGNIIQPFAFTGYQEDEISELNFAQARYYNSNTGRFISEDQVRGVIILPDTQNHYLYCINIPNAFVDRDGKFLVTVLAGAAIGGLVCGAASAISQAAKGEKVDWGQVGKDALKGVAVGAVVGTGVGAVALAGTTAATAAAGAVAVNAGIGAVQGGIAAASTGGSVVNGMCGGAIDGMVTEMTKKVLGPYGANFAGGAAGSVVSDTLDNIDKPGTHSLGEIAARAGISGVTQMVISGTLDSLVGNSLDKFKKIGYVFSGIFGTGTSLAGAGLTNLFPGHTDVEEKDG